MYAQPLAYDQSIKLNMSHNISTIKIQELRFELTQTIGSIKEQVEKRYGSDSNFVALVLRDRQGNFVTNMTNDLKFLGSYDPQDGYEIYVIDSNPNSVLKGLEDMGQVQKYTMPDEDYDKLPNTMRKFKQQFIQQQAAGGNIPDGPVIDDTYQEVEAMQIAIGTRCQIVENQNRGTVRYVGQVPQMGLGYFVGIQLDEPIGTCNGSIMGYPYFQTPNKYGIFLRPKEIQIGDYPELDLDEI